LGGAPRCFALFLLRDPFAIVGRGERGKRVKQRRERVERRASSPSGSDQCTKRESFSLKREKRQNLSVDSSHEAEPSVGRE
jgi:hypothetical protein